MLRRLWAPIAALVVSCHTSSGAQNRATDDPTASEPAEIPPFDADIVLTAQPSTIQNAVIKRTMQTTAPIEAPPDAGPVSLCCDLPSGLCYPDDGALCLTETSRMIECPAVAVREITAGFVVCAD